jgi:hypothetical protein
MGGDLIFFALPFFVSLPICMPAGINSTSILIPTDELWVCSELYPLFKFCVSVRPCCQIDLSGLRIHE